MTLSVSEIVMFSSLQVIMLDNDKRPIGCASGFLAAFGADGDSFIPTLVTNRHVLGRCPYIALIFTLKKPDGLPDIGKTKTVIISTESCILHPNDQIDLAVLPLEHTISQMKASGTPLFCPCIDTRRIPTPDEWQSFDAIEQVVMTGFPKGLRDTANNLPITRHGFTATHPALNYQGKPAFLVDMPCFAGCSGSPVYLVGNRVYQAGNQHKPIGTDRFYLLGVQYAIPSVKDTGELKNAPEPMEGAAPVMQLHLDLGCVVKSSELLVFDALLREAAKSV